MRYVYLVTAGSKCATSYNKKASIRAAKAHNGQVYRVARSTWRDGLYPYGWDRPTCILHAERIHYPAAPVSNKPRQGLGRRAGRRGGSFLPALSLPRQRDKMV